MRHGETFANKRGIFQGQSLDGDLTLLGKKQSRKLGNYFKSVKVDKIYTSPMKRTFKTAEIISQTKGGKVEIVKDREIIETDHGLWEKKDKKYVGEKWPRLLKMWSTKPSKVEFPEGEKFKETSERVMNFFNKIKKQNGTYVVVTHGNIIQIITTHLKKKKLDNIWDYTPKSASLSLIRVSSPARLVYFNKTDHLEGLESDLKEQAI